jgi:hypothetical protein
MGIVRSIRKRSRKENQSMIENKFTIGYNVRIVGRLARLVGGLIPLVLILMDIIPLDNPIPKVDPLILLRDTALYLIAVAAASAILAAAMSYGGCEVVALPALLFKRRHVVDCPYNIVDVIEDAVVKKVQKKARKTVYGQILITCNSVFPELQL